MGYDFVCGRRQVVLKDLWEYVICRVRDGITFFLVCVFDNDGKREQEREEMN